MWSLGIIIYLLLGGTMPFIGRTKRELFHAIIEGRYSFPDEYWHNVSPAAKELISNLLQVDPDLRWTARQALQCTWIQNSSTAELAQHDLQKSARELKFFNARLKFKAAIIGVACTRYWQRWRLKKQNESMKLPAAFINNNGGVSTPHVT
jgi:serine/threonine protein kinase